MFDAHDLRITFHDLVLQVLVKFLYMLVVGRKHNFPHLKVLLLKRTNA